MKTAFLCLITGFILAACPSEPRQERLEDEEYYHRIVYKELFDALENGDAESLAALFSPNAQNNINGFDSKINDIFDFVDGKLITRHPHPLAGGSGSVNSGDQNLTIESVNNFLLDSAPYSMQFIWYKSNIRGEEAKQGISVILITTKTAWHLDADDPGIYIEIES